jgi:hypothetical protein
VLAKCRKRGEFPFRFREEYEEKDRDSCLGLYDLSPDHFYQLLRMTLLAQATTPSDIGEYRIEDYRIVHLSHSQNEMLNIVQPEYLEFSPGLRQYVGQSFHSVWHSILSDQERARFRAGHWDQAIPAIPDNSLRTYLLDRYGHRP